MRALSKRDGLIHSHYTHFSPFSTARTNHEHGCCTNLFFRKKSFFLFVYFHSFQTFLKEFSLTRAGPNFEFASKFFFFLQTKYKITRHTRTFICDMPIALILRPKEAEVFFFCKNYLIFFQEFGLIEKKSRKAFYYLDSNSIQNCWEISIFQMFLIQIRTSRYYFDKFFGF